MIPIGKIMLFYKKELVVINDYLIKKYIINSIINWNAWEITRSDLIGHINFNYNVKKTNCGMYATFLSNHWENLVEIEPNLTLFNPNLKKSWIAKTIPGGGIFPHIDYNRKISTIIPLGNNKGEIKFHLHYTLPAFYTHTYTGPTTIRTNITHSLLNNSNTDRYALQFY